jgi:hypothetical protein
MLTTAEEDRLEATFPLKGIAVEYKDESYTYDISTFWAGGDENGDDATAAPDHPALVFDWDTQSEPATERQPVDDVASIDNPTDVPEYRETKTAEVYDELSVTVAVEATHDANGVPPQTRGGQLARRLWRFTRHEIDLNTTGPNGERPMRVDVQNGPTPSRVQRTYRLEWSIRLHHSETQETVHDTVETVGVEAEQTRD